MNIEINSMDMVQILPILFGVLIGIMLIALAFNQYVHKLDDNKELITKSKNITDHDATRKYRMVHS